jgi:hypothetical protein
MAKRMTAEKRKDLLKRYRGRLDSSRKHREKEQYDALWKRMIDLYRGKHFESQLLSNEDRIAVNLAFATINTMAPSVAVNHPKVVIWAKDNEDEAKATILETVINYWWRHFKIQPQLKLCVIDALILGHGWAKCGWRYVEEEKEISEGTDAADESAAETGSLDAAARGAKDKPDSDEKTANDPDTEMQVAEDRPWVERVSPFDIFVDPEAKTLDDAKWIAQRIIKPLAEVIGDNRYRAAARRCVKPDSHVDPSWTSEQPADRDDIQRVTTWEFYDIAMGTMCVFSELGDELLLDPIKQPYAFGHPFEMIRNYEVPDQFYPMGELEALEPIQLELDKTRSQLMNQRKKGNRKYLYNQAAFDQTGQAALASDRDNLMVPVISNVPLGEAIIPLKQEPMDPQLFNYVEQIEADLDRVSGVSEYERGATPEIRRTATEASMIQDAANARASDKLAQVENFIARVSSKVVQLAQQYLTEDQVARVLGANGHPVWVPFSREDIQGEYDFEVEAGSTQPRNDTARRQQAMMMLQTFGPYAQQGLVNAAELVKYALQFGFDVKDPTRFLVQATPQPPGQKQPSMSERLVESLNYKDAPPDIQRQIEQQAGFQPSQVGGSSPAEGLMSRMAPTVMGQQQQGQQAQMQAQQQAAQMQQQQGQHGAQLAHEASMQNAKHHHEVGKAVVDAHHGAQQSQLEHEQQMMQEEQAARHGLAQTAVQGMQAQQQQEGGEGGPQGS